MPWREATPMSERSEFLTFASGSELTMSALCRRYGVSRRPATSGCAAPGRRGPRGWPIAAGVRTTRHCGRSGRWKL